MPSFLSIPDPQAIAIQHILQNFQDERMRAEAEREKSREAKKKRTATGVGIVAGVLTGGLAAPAIGAIGAAGAGAAAGQVASSGVLGAGANAGDIAGALDTFQGGGGGIDSFLGPATTGGVSGDAGASAFNFRGALEGGLAGGEIGAAFAGAPNLQAGFGAASKAMKTFVQNQEDTETFGGPISKQERAAISKKLIGLGTTLSAERQRAKRTGVPLMQHVQGLQVDQADVKSFDGILESHDIGGGTANFDALARANGQTRNEFLQTTLGERQDIDDQRKLNFAFEKEVGQLDAKAQSIAQNNAMQFVPNPEEAARAIADKNTILSQVEKGEMLTEQGLLEIRKINQRRSGMKLVPRDEETKTQKFERLTHKDEDGNLLAIERDAAGNEKVKVLVAKKSGGTGGGLEPGPDFFDLSVAGQARMINDILAQRNSFLSKGEVRMTREEAVEEANKRFDAVNDFRKNRVAEQVAQEALEQMKVEGAEQGSRERSQPAGGAEGVAEGAVQPTPITQDNAPLQIQEAHGQLQQAIQLGDAEVANSLIDRIQQSFDLLQNPSELDVKMLKDAIEVSQQINAGRNP